MWEGLGLSISFSATFCQLFEYLYSLRATFILSGNFLHSKQFLDRRLSEFYLKAIGMFANVFSNFSTINEFSEYFREGFEDLSYFGIFSIKTLQTWLQSWRYRYLFQGKQSRNRFWPSVIYILSLQWNSISMLRNLTFKEELTYIWKSFFTYKKQRFGFSWVTFTQIF